MTSENSASDMQHSVDMWPSISSVVGKLPAHADNTVQAHLEPCFVPAETLSHRAMHIVDDANAQLSAIVQGHDAIYHYQ